MIICHCSQISDHDIRAAVDWMRAADPEAIITPGKVYHTLGKRPDCGSCMPLFLDTMRHCDNLAVPPILRGLRATRKGAIHEGRRQGHRVSQRSATV
ncbi:MULTISPECIES: bacterioferritin-associated ferredoxin [Paracoccus]|uniref:(2Fe-2S)-binding protein n=1 Tax=Paracoccus litorisediminis TaxID=2006130 RepID=A0A844HJD5_9RHOB|nr:MULTISPECIES: (2Fe-2S)-binding protein [Paracoccus]MBD9525885.1 (2Fe-2S)-binding protein [Paracoccus sp. PAR01]MTH58335.1 (2Fe-2S)-binding protein [Paracoccus litorisediminis]